MRWMRSDWPTEAITAPPFIKSVMDRVVAFQTRAYGGEIHIQWQAGTFYTGVFAAYEATGDEAFREVSQYPAHPGVGLRERLEIAKQEAVSRREFE